MGNPIPQSQSFIEGLDDIQHRMSLNGPILRNYDSDISVFADMRNGGNLNENSFNEQILDRNKLIYA